MNSEKFSELNDHLLHDIQPSTYLNQLADAGQNRNSVRHRPLFDMLFKMKQTDQSPQHHPEGNVWNHTMLVVDEAAKVKHKSKDETAFMWAALLHDIGKPATTRIRGTKITSYDHDKVGARLARIFLQEMTTDTQWIDTVVALIRWHMQILFVVNGLPFAEVKKMKQQVDVDEVALLGLCDRLGRTNADREKEEQNIREFLRLSKGINL